MLERSQWPEVQRNRCGPFAKHIAWWDRRRVSGTDIKAVGLPRPLEKNTQLRQTPQSMSLFSVTNQEQDNVGSSQQGSSYLRPATLGLGGAGSGWDSPRSHTHRRSCDQLSLWIRSLHRLGLNSTAQSRSESRVDHQTERSAL